MKKILLGLVVIFLLVYVLYIFYPKDVNLNAQGIKYRLGNESDEFEQSLNIHIKGMMYRGLTGEKTFKGIIDIEGEDVPVPENQREIKVYFYKGLSGALFYPYVDHGEPGIYSMGQIYISNDFSRVTIAVLDQQGNQGYWSGKNGFMITAPASSKSEAINISNELMIEYLNGYILE